MRACACVFVIECWDRKEHLDRLAEGFATFVVDRLLRTIHNCVLVCAYECSQFQAAVP